MKRVILTTAMIVLTLMSCTPEEQVKEIESTETTETNTEEPIEDDEEPTPEPTPEPVAFAGDWVLWGNFAPHCNCIQEVPEIKEEPLLTIYDDGTLIIQGRTKSWESVVGNTANAHANVVFCEATTTDEGGANISTQSDIVTLNTLGYALTFDNVYSDASTEGNPYQIQIATGPKVIQQTQGTGNILYAGSVLRESGSSGSNTFGTNTIFRANATILVPGAATVTYRWLYSKSNGQPVTAFVNGGVYANAGATTNVLTIGNVSGTLASGTNRFAKQFSAIANSTIMCQASVELPPHLIAVGSNTANLRFSGTTMTANSAIVTMNVLTGGAG